MSTIRVRFAPSPTGHLHIGGLRTALFNLLFARHYEGAFLLRIEDTDIERSREIFTKSIIESLNWASIESDEPIVVQSERLSIYKKVIEQLLNKGNAYRCYCPSSGVGQQAEGFTKYDGRCRNLSAAQQDPSKPFTIRIKIPENLSQVSFNDLIRGQITFERNQLDDFIIVRSDGIPVYNFVVVVDDAHMNITHVIRGEDHISNTPKQIILYQVCEFKIPHFAHLPLILGQTGAPLSKRDAATAVLDYKKNGYLANALCNYLVRLGWSHGDQEIFTRDEMIKYFSLEAIGKKGAIFDQNKLDWMNGLYIRQTSERNLLFLIERDVEPNIKKILPHWTNQKIEEAIALYKDRVKTLKELVQELKILHDGAIGIHADDKNKWITGNTAQILNIFLEGLANIKQFNIEELQRHAQDVSKLKGIKLVHLAQPIRLAVIGKSTGPGVFEMLTFLGKEESIKRIADFIQSLQ